MWNVIKSLLVSPGNSSGSNASVNGAGGVDSLTMMPDVDMLVRENERYRSALDSLNEAMESEVGIMTSSIVQNQNLASFL